MFRRLVCALSLLLTASVGAAATVFEAEDFTSRFELGGDAIRRFHCQAASKGTAVTGFDQAGEWISFRLSLQKPVEVRDSLCSAAGVGVRREFTVEFRDVETDRLAGSDTLRTLPGSGLGCHSAAYDWVQSSRPLPLEPGDYVVRLTLLSSVHTRVDRLDIHLRDREAWPASAIAEPDSAAARNGPVRGDSADVGRHPPAPADPALEEPGPGR